MFYFLDLPLQEPIWNGLALALSLLIMLMSLASGGARAVMASSRQGAAIGTVFLLGLLWMAKASVQGTLSVTFAGAALCVVMFGFRGALLVLALADIGYLCIDALSGYWSQYASRAASATIHSDWNNIGLQFLFGSVVPASVSRALIALIRRRLPRHLFVFIFGHGFFTPIVATVVTMILGAIVIKALDVPGSQRIFSDVLPGALLLSWGEAFLTGALTVIFTMFRPQWVLSFDDDIYLRKRTGP